MVATGGMVLATTLIQAPAAQACTLAIATIMSNTATSCTVGDKQFDFRMGGLDPKMSSGYVNISAAGPVYTVNYSGFSTPLTNLTFYFEYTVDVITGPEMIQSLSSSVGSLTSLQALPNTYVDLTFSHGIPPGQSLTSFTNTITQTPAPLPLFGAATALGFSRKLRKRIQAGKQEAATSL